ncbi:MAG TPA: hypothetical protein VIL74_10110 [Pyrinomonadaceae bacterium]|jgi:hypothetical protein
MLEGFDYSKLIGELNLRQKVKFYQTFAQRLTLAARYVYSINLTDAEKSRKMYGLNEIQHRVLAKLIGLYHAKNASEDHWSEADFGEMVKSYAGRNSIEDQVEDSIRESYEDCIKKN